MPSSQLTGLQNLTLPRPHPKPAFSKFRASSRLFWERGVCTCGQSQGWTEPTRRDQQARAGLRPWTSFSGWPPLSCALLVLPFSSSAFPLTLRGGKRKLFQIWNVLFSVSHSCKFHKATSDYVEKMCEVFPFRQIDARKTKNTSSKVLLFEIHWEVHSWWWEYLPFIFHIPNTCQDTWNHSLKFITAEK